ncbi:MULTISPECIES: hypothetical protein [unclassified Streptomyces]|uniref:hypothetical protein n=1 Tax=unclassified Streptomyces TaxID=2593676 RepID=UPI002E2B6E10|nr:hypothetical protein [Streptomyces sp. NBC_01429]
MSADSAAEALRDIDAARARARLRAGLTPAWYGPAAAAALIVPALGEAWVESLGGWGAILSLLISLAGLALLLALVGAARRRTGVMVTLPWSARLRRAAVPFLTLLAAGSATYGLCRRFGADGAVTKVALFTALGLGTWVVFVIRNTTIQQQLRKVG